MSVLLIGTKEQVEIDAAVARARRKPLPLAVLKEVAHQPQNTAHVTLADRPKNFKRPQSEIVLIPMHYQLQISFEEQEPGICMHFSISLLHRAREALPSVESVVAIAKALGIELKTKRDERGFLTIEADERLIKGWIEDFTDDGVFAGRALNFVYVTAPAQEGHA